MAGLGARLRGLRSGVGRAAGRRAVRATLGTSAVNLLVLGLNLGTGLITARLLGPEGRGELVAMVLWPQFLASLLTLGLPQALTFSLIRHPGDARGLVGVTLLLDLVLGGIAIAAGLILIPIWSTHYDAGVIAFAQATLLFAPIILFMWSVNGCLQARGEFRAYNRNLYLQPLLTLLGLGALAVADRVTPFTAAMATVLAPLPVFVVNLVWLLRRQPPALSDVRRNGGRVLGYGIRSFGIQLLGALSQQLDRVVVLGLLSPAAMGLYVVARNTAVPTRMFSSAVNTVLFPKASGLSTPQAIELTALGSRVGLVVTAAIAAALVVAGPTFLGFLYGPAFVGAAGPFQLFVVEGALSAVTGTLAQTFMTVGRPGIVTLLQLAGFSTGALLLLVLVPAYGIIGAAVGLLIGTAARLALTLACFPLVLGVAVPRLWLSGGDLGRLALPARRAHP